DLGGKYGRRIVGGVARDRHGADRGGDVVRRGERKGDGARAAVSAGDRGRVAEHACAHHAAGRLAGVGGDCRAGLDGGQRFVDTIVVRAAVETVAVIRCVTLVGADLGGEYGRRVVGGVARDRHGADRGGDVVRRGQREGDRAGSV